MEFYKIAEMDPKTWRLWVSGLLVPNSIAIGFIFLVMFAGMPKFGSIAWSSEVSREVEVQLEPIKKEVSELKTTVNTQTEITKILLAKLASDKLTDLIRRRCRSTESEDRAYYTEEIRKYKKDYLLARGETYDEPDCTQV